MTTIKKQTKMPPGFWIGILMMCIVLFFTTKCNAQKLDTIPCKTECIKKIISKQNKNSTTLYIVYIDSTNQISDLIPVSKSVFDYISTCQQNGITPSLGIKLKNGQIVSIIKYKPIYIRRYE